MKRLVRIRWLLPLVLVIALLGTWQWYATRPTLVWWTSPPIANSSHRMRVLIPAGWELRNADLRPHGGWAANLWIRICGAQT